MALPLKSAALVVASVTVLSLALGLSPRPQDDLDGLAACLALHPERYCRLTYAPSTVAP